MRKTNTKSILSGVMLTAGTAVGAGMFSLPIVSSGMWFGYSILCLIFLWYLSYLSGLYLLEVNTRFAPGASFNTLVKAILGKRWNTLTGISIAFLLYILLYAYFSAFGSILNRTITIDFFAELSMSQGLLGLLFGGGLAAIIWLSTKWVGRITTVLVISMVIAFVISMFSFALQVDWVNILDSDSTNQSNYNSYIWAALPYFMSSYGFSAIVPSLYKYYGKEPKKVQQSLFWGSMIALFVYGLFLFVVFGNISRAAFIEINQKGGNMGVLVDALSKAGDSTIVNTILTLFSNFAIMTSFLGVGLGLFDYIIDLFSFSNSYKGRFYAACIAFLPPGILSLFFPNGFIMAIGYAGLVCIFSLFVIPFLMIRKTRQKNQLPLFSVKGGNVLLYVFVFSSLFVAVFHVFSKLNLLPVW